MVEWYNALSPWARFALVFVAFTAVMGLVAFVLGEKIPRRWVRYDRFPFAAAPFEKDGRIYLNLRIQHWKDIMPDMSKIFKSTFPKRVGMRSDAQYMDTLIRETCTAELVHWILIALSPLLLLFLRGGFAALGIALYALGNLPFILIQRYNRPRLVTILKRMQMRRK